jgi:hypothetical protein
MHGTFNLRQLPAAAAAAAAAAVAAVIRCCLMYHIMYVPNHLKPEDEGE